VVHPAAGGRTFSYRYGTAGRHRPDRIEESGAPRLDLGWGADGQLCSRIRPGRPPESYRWTADGMLSEIEVPAAGRTTRIVYDHAGARLKTVEGASTTLHLDGTEAAPRGEVVETVRFPTGFCRIPAGNPGAARCYFTDGANVGAVTRGDGAGPSVITYSPFGQPAVIQGQRPGFGYGARRADAATGLVDFGARFYDPESRIFVRPDPLVVQGAPGWESLGLLNPYSYAANNPTSRVELDGRNWKSLKGYSLEWRQLQQAYGPHAGHVMGYHFALDTVYQFVPGANYAHAVVTGKTYVEHRNNLEGSGRLIGALGLTAELGLTLMTGGAGRAPKAPAPVRPPRRLKPLTVGADDAARPAAAVGTSGTGAASGGRAAALGRKLDYLFGRATGRLHNIERSTDMLRQMERIGLRDTPRAPIGLKSL
jgi:RHS repeat-associated protein